MNCIKCGVLLPKGAKFCDKCGTPQEKEVKCSCGRKIEKDYKFCPECGKSFAEVCNKTVQKITHRFIHKFLL